MLKQFLIFFVFSAIGFSSYSQCSGFMFDEIGYEPAGCRLYEYQTGNGVVYASVTGGTPPYTYLWTNLQTGATTNNTTWGGLNIGQYHIYVHDSYGCLLNQIVEVDSINPVADFNILSNDYDSTGMFAFLPFNGEVEVTSESCYLAQPDYPDSDTNFYWQIGAGSPWILGDCFAPQNFDITAVGPYEIKLVTINKNGCTDTLTKILNAVLPTYAPITPDIFCDYTTGEVFINLPGNDGAFFVIYDLNGGIKSTIILEPGLNSIQIDPGISLYKILDADFSEELLRGKLFNGGG